MNKPTTIKTGAVAAAGITINNGAKNKATTNKIEDVIAAIPVRPPSAIPAADSTATICGEAPNIPAIVVPRAATFMQLPLTR